MKMPGPYREQAKKVLFVVRAIYVHMWSYASQDISQ